jgi:hypothetical protein
MSELTGWDLPTPEMRRAGLEQADPQSQSELPEHSRCRPSPTDEQAPIVSRASRRSRFYALALYTMRIIAALAYGVAR